MHQTVLFVLPVAMAATAWSTVHVLLRGTRVYLPRVLKASAGELSPIVAKEIVAAAHTMSVSLNGSGTETMRPLIEAHLDTYLRVRLREKMPVIASFIGDSTLVKLKESMIEEIDVLLPQVVQGYVSSALDVTVVQDKVTVALQQVDEKKIGELVKPLLQPASRRLPWLCAAVALCCGMLLSAALYFLV